MGVFIILAIGAVFYKYKVSICLHVYFSAHISHTSGCRMMGMSSAITQAFKSSHLHRHFNVFDRNSIKLELN